MSIIYQVRKSHEGRHINKGEGLQDGTGHTSRTQDENIRNSFSYSWWIKIQYYTWEKFVSFACLNKHTAKSLCTLTYVSRFKSDYSSWPIKAAGFREPAASVALLIFGKKVSYCTFAVPLEFTSICKCVSIWAWAVKVDCIYCNEPDTYSNIPVRSYISICAWSNVLHVCAEIWHIRFDMDHLGIVYWYAHWTWIKNKRKTTDDQITEPWTWLVSPLQVHLSPWYYKPWRCWNMSSWHVASHLPACTENRSRILPPAKSPSAPPAQQNNKRLHNPMHSEANLDWNIQFVLAAHLMPCSYIQWLQTAAA